MMIDLLAGTGTGARAARCERPSILVLDSGIGGLTVLREIAHARPDAACIYAADDAAFPYGDWDEAPLIRRVEAVVDVLVKRFEPDLVVVACNTISTLVLPTLRGRFPDLPFVGTVPAVKPAVAASRSGRITVLATPGTVRRDYTRGLIDAYAGTCRVDLVGSARLAALAEAELAGEPPPDDAIRAEIAPCFVDADGRRTDVVVLACTHYPLLLERMRRLAPWPVTWIDPAPSVARRVTAILGSACPDPARDGARPATSLAVFTGEPGPSETLRGGLARFGLARVLSGLCPVAAEARRAACAAPGNLAPSGLRTGLLSDRAGSDLDTGRRFVTPAVTTKRDVTDARDPGVAGLRG